LKLQSQPVRFRRKAACAAINLHKMKTASKSVKKLQSTIWQQYQKLSPTILYWSSLDLFFLQPL